MKGIKISFLVFFGYLTSLNVLGQDPRTEQDKVWAQINQQRVNQVVRDDRNGIGKNGMMKQSPASGENRKPLSKEQKEKLEQKAIESTAETKIRLEELKQKTSLPAEYNNRFADFLKAKNTGIARILPDKNCDKGLLVDVKELERCADTAQVKGGGSLYSVRLSDVPDWLSPGLLFYYIGFSDIHFIGDKFVVGNKTTQDIIGNIGEVDLEDVTAKTVGVKFLMELKPSKNASKLQLQNRTFEKGVSSDGYFYSNSVPVKVNNTYILRSIVYYHKYQEFENFWNTDLLVALKVVGQEKDGSIIVLWKKLKEKNAPYLSDK